MQDLRREKQKGMAIFEVIPVMVIVILFVTFSFGFFGVIHTGILTSMSARNYTIETFRHRADLIYMRSTTDTSYIDIHYKNDGARFHGTVDRPLGTPSSVETWNAVGRKIDFMRESDAEGNEKNIHNRVISRQSLAGRWEIDGVNPVWVKSGYGICINSACGDQ